MRAVGATVSAFRVSLSQTQAPHWRRWQRESNTACAGIESAPGLRLCGMRGLAQLAGDDRAHSDMARARVDASMIELMRRPQVLRTIAQRDTDLFAAALSRCVRWSERERALKGERERGRE